jgi:hypothetical protein
LADYLAQLEGTDKRHREPETGARMIVGQAGMDAYAKDEDVKGYRASLRTTDRFYRKGQ